MKIIGYVLMLIFFTSVLYSENPLITIKCISVFLSFKTLAKIGDEQLTFKTMKEKVLRPTIII